MININDGIITIAEGLVITPKFSFEQFKKTKFYNNQDGIKMIYLDKQQVIDGRKYMISLFFRMNIIYMVSLICCDVDFTENEEQKRKLLHDDILKEYGINKQKSFDWGKISSDYDKRSNVSSINIFF